VGYLLKDRVGEVSRFVDRGHPRGRRRAPRLDPLWWPNGPAAERRPAGRADPREAEVLGQMAEGLSNRAIAVRLDVSERAVEVPT